MPCFYSHYSLAADALPLFAPPVRELILRNRGSFDLGAQGPDAFLFYIAGGKKKYIPLGNLLQAGLVGDALRELLQNAVSEREKAYFAGYLCHYALDCAAHPYIMSQICGEDHTRFELLLDSTFLVRRGDAPDFQIGSVLPNTPVERGLDALWSPVLSKYCGETDEAVFSGGIRCMRRYLRLCNDKTGFKKRFYAFAEGIFGRGHELSDMMFRVGKSADFDILNLEHRAWTPPWGVEVRNESYPELYGRGLADAVRFVAAAARAWDGGSHAEALAIFGSRDHGTAMEGKQPKKQEPDECVFGEACVKKNRRFRREMQKR